MYQRTPPLSGCRLDKFAKRVSASTRRGRRYRRRSVWINPSAHRPKSCQSRRPEFPPIGCGLLFPSGTCPLALRVGPRKSSGISRFGRRQAPIQRLGSGQRFARAYCHEGILLFDGKERNPPQRSHQAADTIDGFAQIERIRIWLLTSKSQQLAAELPVLNPCRTKSGKSRVNLVRRGDALSSSLAALS